MQKASCRCDCLLTSANDDGGDHDSTLTACDRRRRICTRQPKCLVPGRLPKGLGLSNSSVTWPPSSACRVGWRSVQGLRRWSWRCGRLTIGAGDEVIMPSYVCAAPWLATQRVGAQARLVDIDLNTFNIDPLAARRAVTKKTRAIIVPHLFGLPADLDGAREARDSLDRRLCADARGNRTRSACRHGWAAYRLFLLCDEDAVCWRRRDGVVE